MYIEAYDNKYTLYQTSTQTLIWTVNRPSILRHSRFDFGMTQSTLMKRILMPINRAIKLTNSLFYCLRRSTIITSKPYLTNRAYHNMNKWVGKISIDFALFWFVTTDQSNSSIINAVCISIQLFYCYVNVTQ